MSALCSAKDIPVYYLFNFPELARFRIFQWQHTIKTELASYNKAFLPANIDNEDYKIAKAIARVYAKIPFVEIWNNETLNSILRQILYVHHIGLFGEKHLGILLCQQLENIIGMIEQQARTGIRWYEGNAARPEVKHLLYYNNILLLDNSYYFKTERYQLSMVSYNTVDYLITFNVSFANEISKFLHLQKNKSTLITEASEHQRIRFFKGMYAKVARVKRQLKG